MAGLMESILRVLWPWYNNNSSSRPKGSSQETSGSLKKIYIFSLRCPH